MSENSEITGKEVNPNEPGNLFSLFPKFKFQLPFLKPKDGSVAEEGPREAVVADDGSKRSESPKPVVVRIPKAQVVDPPRVAVENEELSRSSDPFVLWQVYALGGFMILRWIWARWNERKKQKKNPSEDDDDQRSAE